MYLQILICSYLLFCCSVFIHTKSVGDCNFENDNCLWTNAKGEDDFDWTRKKGKTLSSVTGPNGDHTTGYGTYLYIETSSPRSRGQVARLLSPWMRGPQCMTLWYHMLGINMGSLIIYANNSDSLNVLWLKGGSQGHSWHKAQIDIPETGEYKVEIDGIRGKSFQSDAAIDDISFYPGFCKEQAPPNIFVYADYVHHGLMYQEGLPSPGPRALQYSLHIPQDPFNQQDHIYLLCEAKTGLKIVQAKHTPRKAFPCEHRDFFFSSNFSREGLYSFYVIDRGDDFPQTITLKNDTTYCDGSSNVMELFASSIDLSVNLAHNSTALQSSQLPAFPPLLAVDDNHLTCAKTPKQDDPWMEIRLNGLRFVYKIYITTRQNCSHSEHLPNMTVTIHDQKVQVSCQTTDRFAKKSSRAFLCQPPLRAHRVRLQALGEQIQLSICEVIVNAIDSLEQLQGVRSETWLSISRSIQLETFMKSPKRHNSPDNSRIRYYFFDRGSGFDDYGQRLTGFIQPPIDGTYKFYANCDDQCKVWMKELRHFHDVSFFEDLDYQKQRLWQLIYMPRYVPMGRWSTYSFQRRYKYGIDSCRMYMLEEVGKEAQGEGYMGVGWKKPNRYYNRPLYTAKLFWILPGLQILHAKLLEPTISQRSLVFGQTVEVLMSYRLCCHGIYCPSCPKFVKLQLLGHTFMVNSSLSSTCQWHNYTRNIMLLNFPGKYNVEILESKTNTSTPTKRTISVLDIKAHVLQSCLYQDKLCSWTIKGYDGRMGWVALPTANNKEHHFEAQPNTTAWLQSPTIQPQSLYWSIGLCLVFRYRNNHESSQLEVIVNTFYNKTVLWYLKGMQGSQWKEARLPWPDVAVSQILIRGKADTNSSVAISSIRLLTLNCTLKPKHAKPDFACQSSEFQCHNGECVKSSKRCDGDYACVDRSDESNCACQSSEYKCPDGKCLPLDHLCNGQKECRDGSDEASCENPCKEFSCFDGSCVAWSVTCDGVRNCQDGSDEPDICSSLGCPLNNPDCGNKEDQREVSKDCQKFRGPCTFEYGFCGFTTNGTNQRIETKWQIKKGQTPTSNTGPSYDHTKRTASGSYLYLEASGLDPGDSTELYSDWLIYNTNVTCLQFWYHMWGSHVGDLNIYIMTNETKDVVWSKSGGAGPKWLFGQIPLYSNGRAFKFVFEATVGDGYEGDIAIDDVDLLTGKCVASTINQSPSEFAFINPENSDVTPEMISPTILPQNDLRCLRFWFIIKTQASLKLYSINSSNVPTLLWDKNELTKDWTIMQVPLQTQHKYQLLFKATIPPQDKKLLIALDDIILSRDSCQKAIFYNKNCKQRTTSGDCCVFPFVYKNNCYTYCIGGDEFDPWCSITDNYDRDGLKGTCVNGNPALQAPPPQRTCRVMTTNSNQSCFFPFVYRGLYYSQCLSIGSSSGLGLPWSKPWCGTTWIVDSNRRYGWAYCDSQSLDRCGLCKQKTKTMSCCVFPFIFNSRTFYNCTTSYHDRYWCSLTGDYDRDTLREECIGYETRDCKTIYGKQNEILQWTAQLNSSSNFTWSPRMPTRDVVRSQDTVSLIRKKLSIRAGLFEMAFSGSFPRLNVTNIPEMSSFTACVWIKTKDTVNEGTPFRYKVRYNGNNFTEFGLINYKNIVVKLMDNTKISGVSANDGYWHHLCFVWTSKGGVAQMYKDGQFIVQGRLWQKNNKIPGGGVLHVGTDGFVGNMSGMNIWSFTMGLSEIAQRAVGCGIEGGDIMDWSVFSQRANLVYPPSCLDAGGKGYKITPNLTNPTTATLISNLFNGPLVDYTISFCLHFRYMLIGQAAKSLKIYRSVRKKEDNRYSFNDELLWQTSSTSYTSLWRFGTVSFSTLQLFKIKVSAELGLGEGSVGLAGYFLKPGYCRTFSAQEKIACQVNMTSQSGSFSSPYFPAPYPKNTVCKWWIIQPAGYVIRLEFLSFILEDSQSCRKDYVKIYDGPTVRSNMLGYFCGDSFPLLLESSSNSLLVVFKSDNDQSLSGFKMSYTSYRKEKGTCTRIENCPATCTCSSLKENPTSVIIYCKRMTAIPIKTPDNTIAMMLSGNRLSRIKPSSSSQLQYMDLSHSYLLSVTPSSFIGLTGLKTLRMNFNFIDEIQPNVFSGLASLENLDLSNNLLSSVKDKILDDVQNLKVLSLRSNRIIRLEKDAFKFVNNLTHLYLQGNMIETIPDGLFDTLESLKVLYLNNNRIRKVSKDTFRNLRSLQELYLNNNHLQSLDETAFSHLQNLRVIKLDRFVFCCYAIKSIPDLTCKSPASAFSSCDDLMKNKTLQVFIWILGILAFLGNIAVIIWRLIVKERNRVHSFLLTNLAVSDLLMGVYLLIIAIKDLQWRGVYFKHDLQWRSSRVCQLAGALSVVSSEVSVLILTTITADRYSNIVYAFKFKKLKMKSAVFLVFLIWIFGFIMAIVPTLYSDYFYDYDWEAGFYGRSGVCLPLQLSHERFPGWEYSVAIFIGLNFIAFSFILVAYIIMFLKVRSAGRSVRSTQMNNESAMARKMAFIILTDFCCWMPIIIIGVLSLLGKFHDPEKLAYVWIAVFVLPVNSSINPVLYTFSNSTWLKKNRDVSLLDSIRNRVTSIISRGLLNASHVEMVNYPSVIDVDSTVTVASAAHSPPGSLNGSSGKPKINIQKTNIFEGEFSPSVSFYRSSCEGKEGSMFLFKHFCHDQRSKWSREVDVIDQLRKDGGHPNIMNHLWYSQDNETPVLIDLTNLETLKGHGFMICYDLPSCTTLNGYLSKPEAYLITQTLLVIATDVINALSYLERCHVRHNHVTDKNILIKESFMVPTLQAVLGGFGQATLVSPLDLEESELHNDIKQYGTLVEQLVSHSLSVDPDNQIKDIAIKCQQAPNTLSAATVRDLIEEVWDGTGTWDTLL